MEATAVRILRPLSDPIVEQADRWRLEASALLEKKRRSALGQFLTPAPIASFMASFFRRFGANVRILDAGAGVGSLVASAIVEAAGRSVQPVSIEVKAFEIDSLLANYLRMTCARSSLMCEERGIKFDAKVIARDFIEAAVEDLEPSLFSGGHDRLGFSHAILNPPYKKLASSSVSRAQLRRVGIETSNLYTAFAALAIKLLVPEGEMVAITPRSFCNGPYFRPFREFLFRETSLRRIHLFESRTAAFADDEVLQENVIFHVVKGQPQGRVTVSFSDGPNDGAGSSREVRFEQIVRTGDPERFIHVVTDRDGDAVAQRFDSLPCKLRDLDLSVSTGKVVDFRAKEFLRSEPAADTGPLVYPTHFTDGAIEWPKVGKKPNALVDSPETKGLWMPTGTYVLVKRFSSKEERRRVVAAVFDPSAASGERIGFENHLNVFHSDGVGIPMVLARGLAAFLNSTLVDTHFRQFNGHTQVNATDLRSLRYPSRASLLKLGARLPEGLPTQPVLDEMVDAVLVSARDRSRGAQEKS
jgi:adenine-specific DNA-methyltransferase